MWGLKCEKERKPWVLRLKRWVWACVCLTKTDGLNCFSLHPRLWHFLCPSLRDTRNPSFVFLIPYPSLFSSCTTSPGKITTHKCTEELACLDFKSFKCIWVQMSSLWAYILAWRSRIRLVSRGTSVGNLFGSPFSSKAVVCGHCFVTFSFTINETLKWLSSLPVLTQESF